MESKTFTVGASTQTATDHLPFHSRSCRGIPTLSKTLSFPLNPQNPTLVSKSKWSKSWLLTFVPDSILSVKIMIVSRRSVGMIIWNWSPSLRTNRIGWEEVFLFNPSMPQLFRLFVRRALVRKSKRKGRRHVDQHAGRVCSRSHVWHWCDRNHCKLTLMWGNIPLNSHRLTW